MPTDGFKNAPDTLKRQSNGVWADIESVFAQIEPVSLEMEKISHHLRLLLPLGLRLRGILERIISLSLDPHQNSPPLLIVSRAKQPNTDAQLGIRRRPLSACGIAQHRDQDCRRRLIGRRSER